MLLPPLAPVRLDTPLVVDAPLLTAGVGVGAGAGFLYFFSDSSPLDEQMSQLFVLSRCDDAIILPKKEEEKALIWGPVN